MSFKTLKEEIEADRKRCLDLMRKLGIPDEKAKEYMKTESNMGLNGYIAHLFGFGNDLKSELEKLSQDDTPTNNTIEILDKRFKSLIVGYSQYSSQT